MPIARISLNYHVDCEPTQATQIRGNTTNQDKRIVPGNNYSAVLSPAPTPAADSTEGSAFVEFTSKMVS